VLVFLISTLTLLLSTLISGNINGVIAAASNAHGSQAGQAKGGRCMMSRDCWILEWKREAVVAVLSHMILLHAQVMAEMASTLRCDGGSQFANLGG
jgi:hypothetical protein